MRRTQGAESNGAWGREEIEDGRQEKVKSSKLKAESEKGREETENSMR